MKISNNKLHDTCATIDMSLFIKKRQQNYAGQLIRNDWSRVTKKTAFNDNKYKKSGRSVPSLLDQIVRNGNTTVEAFCNRAMNKKKMEIGDEPKKSLQKVILKYYICFNSNTLNVKPCLSRYINLSIESRN